MWRGSAPAAVPMMKNRDNNDDDGSSNNKDRSDYKEKSNNYGRSMKKKTVDREIAKYGAAAILIDNEDPL